MNGGREQLVDDQLAISIVEELLGLPDEQREAAVTSKCVSDAMATRVRAMLAADDCVDQFLDDPPALRLAGLSHAPANTLPSGARVSRYRIESVLGCGAMGEVYEAESRTGEVVALKVLRSGSATREARRRFEFEAAALSRLRHPNIAALIESGEFDAGRGCLPYLAMELVRGPTITAYARNARLQGPTLVDMYAKVCDAVDHAHRRGVIHRDLKPANILVDTASGEPKVVDFGIARELDPSATLSTLPGERLIGSVPYMSPEQAEGRTADTRSDVYALGVILYELIAGRPAFPSEGMSLPELARRVRDEARPALTQPVGFGKATRDVSLVVARAMAIHAEDRYPSAGQLAADLRGIATGRLISIRPPSLWTVAVASAKRHKRAMAFAGVVLAVVLSIALFAARQFVRAQGAEQRADQLLEELVRGSDHLAIKLNEKLASNGASLETRRAALEASMEYLQDFRTRGGGDPRVDEKIAETYMRLARVVGGVGAGSLGQVDAATDLLERAEAILVPLLAAGDTNTRRVDLAEVLEQRGLIMGSPDGLPRMRQAAEHLSVVAARTTGEESERLYRRANYFRMVAALRGQDVGAMQEVVRVYAAYCRQTPSIAKRWSELGLAQRYLCEMLVDKDERAALEAALQCRESLNRSAAIQGDEYSDVRHMAMNDLRIAYFQRGQAPAEDLLTLGESAVARSHQTVAVDFADNFRRDSHLERVDAYADLGVELTRIQPAPTKSIGPEEIARRVAALVRLELQYLEANRPPSLKPQPRDAVLLGEIADRLSQLDAISAGKPPGE
ncbi:MAG: serine/threonine-protein kinase [Phycisphaerales bacterium]